MDEAEHRVLEQDDVWNFNCKKPAARDTVGTNADRVGRFYKTFLEYFLKPLLSLSHISNDPRVKLLLSAEQKMMSVPDDAATEYSQAASSALSCIRALLFKFDLENGVQYYREMSSISTVTASMAGLKCIKYRFLLLVNTIPEIETLLAEFGRKRDFTTLILPEINKLVRAALSGAWGSLSPKEVGETVKSVETLYLGCAERMTTTLVSLLMKHLTDLAAEHGSHKVRRVSSAPSTSVDSPAVFAESCRVLWEIVTDSKLLGKPVAFIDTLRHCERITPNLLKEAAVEKLVAVLVNKAATRKDLKVAFLEAEKYHAKDAITESLSRAALDRWEDFVASLESIAAFESQADVDDVCELQQLVHHLGRCMKDKPTDFDKIVEVLSLFNTLLAHNAAFEGTGIAATSSVAHPDLVARLVSTVSFMKQITEAVGSISVTLAFATKLVEHVRSTHTSVAIKKLVTHHTDSCQTHLTGHPDVENEAGAMNDGTVWHILVPEHSTMAVLHAEYCRVKLNDRKGVLWARKIVAYETDFNSLEKVTQQFSVECGELEHLKKVLHRAWATYYECIFVHNWKKTTTPGDRKAAIVNFKKKLEHASRKSTLALVRHEIWDMVVKTCVKMIDVE